MTADPRALALDVLLQVERGARSDESLARALQASSLEGADRRLATQLVYGTLTWQRTLDHTAETFASRPLHRMDAPVRVALRMGLFQLGVLDRVPAYAAISTSVDLVRSRAASAGGFVNALLRRAQREGLVPPPSSPYETKVGIATSHPDWLVSMWRGQLGQTEAEALLEADNGPAPTVHRALGTAAIDEVLRALAARGLRAQRGRFGARALVAVGAAPAAQAGTDRSAEAGAYPVPGLTVVQGEASQLVVEMLDPRPGQRILDACAAPGGKTAYIAALVGYGGSVAAVDSSPQARSRIEASLAAADVQAGVEVHVQDLREFATEEDRRGSFDAVLVDAPCSGLGTLRQHPEIRWRRTPADVDDLAERQASILAAASALVRPGGRLVYSTCTVSRRENEEVVAAFLATHRSFFPQPAGLLPSHVAELCDRDGVMRTFPHLHDLDGFFAQALVRGG